MHTGGIVEQALSLHLILSVEALQSLRNGMLLTHCILQKYAKKDVFLSGRKTVFIAKWLLTVFSLMC